MVSAGRRTFWACDVKPRYVFPAILLVLAACQPEAVPVIEAKKALVQFDAGTVALPPRTVDDISALLNAQGGPNLEQRERLLAAVRAPEPTPGRGSGNREASPNGGGNQGAGRGGSGGRQKGGGGGWAQSGTALTRADFFYDRSLAWRQLGDLEQSYKDIRKAFGILRNIGRRFGRSPQFAALFQKVRKAFFSQASKLSDLDLALDFYKTGIGKAPQASLYLEWVEALARAGRIEELRAAAQQGIAFIDDRLARAQSRMPDEKKDKIRAISASIQITRLEAEGRWKEAEPYYRQIFALPTNMMRGVQRNSRQALAGNLRQQGRLTEAEIQAREGLTDTIRELGAYHTATARALRSLARIFEAQGRAADAERLALRAIEIYGKIGMPKESAPLGSVRFLLGEIRASQGDWKTAARRFDEMRSGLANNTAFFKGLVLKNAAIPLTLVKAGRADDAIVLLRDIVTSQTTLLGPRHARVGKSNGILGMAFTAKGDDTAALSYFKKSVPILTSRFRADEANDDGDDNSRWDIRVILNGYLDFVLKIRGTPLERQLDGGATSESFRIADLIRSSAVQGALASAGARSTAGNVGNAALADLIRTSQNVGKQLATLFAVMSNSAADPDGETPQSTLDEQRRKIAALQEIQESLFRQISQQFPDYANLVSPAPARIADIQRVLGADEALIATYVEDERTLVWAIPKRGAATLHTVARKRQQLTQDVSHLRRALDPQAGTLADIPAFDVAAAHELYRSLLEPVKSGWAGARSLLIVPHGALGQLPFQLLVTDGRSLPAESGALFSNYRSVAWLARDYAVSVLPSATSLVSLRTSAASLASPSQRRPFFGVGDPFFNSRQATSAAVQVATAAATRGAPLPAPDHALRAAQAALDCRIRLVQLNRELTGLKAPLGQRIGLNSGAALIGNIGSDRRFNYTAMGDTVNLAARLEGANKVFGTEILVSETTAKGAPTIPWRELDWIRVVGRETPVAVLTPILPGQEALAAAYGAALAAFRRREFAKTVECLAAIAQPDKASALLRQRAQNFLTAPPPADWQPINDLAEK